MKITILIPHSKISGGIKVMFIYAEFLAKFGHQVKVIVPHLSMKEKFLHSFFLFKKPAFARSNLFSVRFIKNLQEENLKSSDVTIACNVSTAEILNSFSERMGKKVYSIQHDEGLYHYPQEEVNKVFKFNLHRIVVSSWLQEVLKNKYGVESEVVLNTVDKETFKPVQVNKKSNSNIIILMLHHTYEWKGTRKGIALVRELKRKYANIKLILFGARKRKIDLFHDEYHYKPSIKKLVELYSYSDIFLCPSWDEGFGLPSVEAMACKCALVTYDNGGSHDYAFDGRTAMVAKRRDGEELKTKLEKLINNKELRREIAEKGYEFIQKMPTWKEQVRKLESIIK